MPDPHARAPGPGLVLDGMVVAPPMTEGQARSLARAGILADDAPGLRRAWARLVSDWESELARARAEPGEDRLYERVNGEWSFIETLRHLVFVTDSWIAQGVLGDQDLHPLGLPPHFVTNGAELGLDLDAAPNLGQVLAARRARQDLVPEALQHTGELTSPCHGRLAGFSRLGAFQVTMAEEFFHLGFARRDLRILRAG